MYTRLSTFSRICMCPVGSTTMDSGVACSSRNTESHPHRPHVAHLLQAACSMELALRNPAQCTALLAPSFCIVSAKTCFAYTEKRVPDIFHHRSWRNCIPRQESASQTRAVLRRTEQQGAWFEVATDGSQFCIVCRIRHVATSPSTRCIREGSSIPEAGKQNAIKILGFLDSTISDWGLSSMNNKFPQKPVRCPRSNGKPGKHSRKVAQLNGCTACRYALTCQGKESASSLVVLVPAVDRPKFLSAGSQ